MLMQDNRHIKASKVYIKDLLMCIRDREEEIHILQHMVDNADVLIEEYSVLQSKYDRMSSALNSYGRALRAMEHERNVYKAAYEDSVANANDMAALIKDIQRN
jgi:hypothetical protein